MQNLSVFDIIMEFFSGGSRQNGTPLNNWSGLKMKKKQNKMAPCTSVYVIQVSRRLRHLHEKLRYPFAVKPQNCSPSLSGVSQWWHSLPLLSELSNENLHESQFHSHLVFMALLCCDERRVAGEAVGAEEQTAVTITGVPQAAFPDHNVQYQFRTENSGGQVSSEDLSPARESPLIRKQTKCTWVMEFSAWIWKWATHTQFTQTSAVSEGITPEVFQALTRWNADVFCYSSFPVTSSYSYCKFK